MFKHFSTRITVFGILAAIMLFTASSAHAITIRKSPSPATPGKPVTFYITLGDTGCQVTTDFGDGSAPQVVNPPLPQTSMTIQHTYTRPGLYTVSVSSFNCAGVLPPNPTSTTIRVADLSITRMELKFGNNQPRITVKRNQKIKGLKAKVSFTGSGLLQGYWEVDGVRKINVFQQVRKGPYVEIEYPEIPPLSTFIPGTHRVRLILTSPNLEITYPQAIYFVRADEVERLPIALFMPQADMGCDFSATVFNWKNVKRASVYHLRFYGPETDEPIFSAFTKKSEYRLREKPLKSRFEAGRDYRWQVFAVDGTNNIIAQSKIRSFFFKEALAYLPGIFMLITDQNVATPGLKSGIMDEFNADVIDEYVVKTLNLTVTVFSTSEDVLKVIAAVKNRPGVILAQPDYIYQTFSEPLSDMQDLERLIGLSDRKITGKGKGVSVGVVDTAVDGMHRDLSGAVLFQQDFISKNKTGAEAHGTGVAGLIAARINAFGMQGVAPESGILALRACRQISKDNSRGECYSHAVIKALDTGMEQGASIINLSLGMQSQDPILSRLIQAGARRNILFVAPVGNRSDMAAVNFPASHPDVIAVCGLLPDGRLFPNDRVAGLADIAVPCHKLLTTIPGNDHNFMSGTSMSCAVVSGLLALCREADDTFDLKAFRALGGNLDNLLGFLQNNKKNK